MLNDQALALYGNKTFRKLLKERVRLTEVYHEERKDLLAFVKKTFKRYKYPNFHHRILCDACSDWAIGKELAVMIFAPPRHMKTETVERACTWALGLSPDERLMLASYSLMKARKMSRNVKRNLFLKATDRIFPWIQYALRDECQDGQDLWQIADGYIGQVLASGVRGAMTGEGFTKGVIDDPFKSREEAESITYRDNTFDWYEGTFLNRQDSENAGILIINTRWHPDDLCGRLLKKDGIKTYNGKKPSLGCPEWNGKDEGKWTVINLVAIFEKNDGLLPWKHVEDPREEEEALWPQRFPLHFLEQFRSNKYNWRSLYKGVPRSKEGNFFNLEWFCEENEQKWSHETRFVRFWDLAGTRKDDLKKNDPDYLASALCAYHLGRFYILDITATRDTPKENEKLIKFLFERDFERFGGTIEEVWEEEPGASAKYVSSMLHSLYPMVKTRALRVDKNKDFYASFLANKAEAGIVSYINGRWATLKLDHGTVWDELQDYPNAVHDDRCDALFKAVFCLAQTCVSEKAESQTFESHFSKNLDTDLVSELVY
jgi:phage terminase large subunit-like protein